MESAPAVVYRESWNKGKIGGQKAAFKPKDIWALRVRLRSFTAERRTYVRSSYYWGTQKSSQLSLPWH